MAYDYNKYKSVYQGLNQQQKQQRVDKYGNTDEYKQFQKDYLAEINGRNNTVSTPNNTTPTYTYGDTGGAANATKYTGTGVSSAGNYTYNQNLITNDLGGIDYAFGNNAVSKEKANPGYLEQRNNYIANALYNEGKTDRQSVENYLMGFDDYKTYDKVGQKNTVDAIMNRIGTVANQSGSAYNRNASEINSKTMNEIYNNYNNASKGYSDLMGGSSNYYNNYRDAVEGKMQEAFGMSLDEFRQRYPEQYPSVYQTLQNMEQTWNAVDPSQRQLLDAQLQAILGTGVGVGSDWSKLNVLESSILNKFKNPEKIKQDAQNVIKLQTEGKNTAEIASEMGMSEDQVQQLVLLANGLDSKAGEYYQLKDNVAKDITEPYDTKMERLEEEKKIALERANRQVDWLKQDYDTAYERQKQQNDINAHNADAIAGRTGLGFSKRGIEGMNYVNDQAKQILDDLTKNYDRNNQQLADGIADIIRNWTWNNEDLMKASQEALTNAKNAYTSNMLAIQQQYGTVGLQAQQALAQNAQSFIDQATNLYDNMLAQQQQNLSNLITNVSNMNAIAAQNLTMRQAKIEQFQSESMNLNRNQLQNLADQLGMDTASYQDLVNYQAQAVANQLNGYLPGSGVQFQSQIQSLLDSGYTPNQAISSIMNSQEFKEAQQAAAGSGENWAMSNGIMYNKATGEYIDLNGDEYGTVGDNLYNKRTGEIISGNAANGDNYVSSQVIDGKEYGTTVKTIQGLQNFYNNHPIGSTGGQCGSFVNDYLQSLGLGRVFTDPIDKKVAAINTPQGYKGQVGDVIVMDSPNPKTKQYGHVAIIIGVNEDGTYQTLESNKKGEGEIFTRKALDPNKTKIYGYYHPDGASAVMNGSNYDGGYNPDLEFVFENMAKNNGQLDSTTQKNLLEKGYSLEDIGQQYNNYKQRHQEDNSYELPEGFIVTNQKLFDQADNKADITTTINTYNNLWSSANKLKDLVLEYGTEIWNTKAKTQMTQYIRDIQLQAKELYNLGVLNGPDLELMESVIYNPTTTEAKWNSFIRGRSKQDIWDLMENGITTVSEKAVNKLKNYGVSVDSGETQGSTNLVGDQPINTNGGRLP